ncbi:MAG: aspartate--tRNA ligase [Gemmataceae bacterium]|nr:aspartate--tRNA ligase [Gemmataceae bacterium]
MQSDWRRTHHCGELRVSDTGKTVVLNGWVNSLRGYNQQVFVDMRDRYGITQAVFESDTVSQQKDLFQIAEKLGREFVIAVLGKVRPRLPGKENLDHATGSVEVLASEIRVLNQCPTPPFEVTEFPGEEIAGEDIRLQYRYLDLRRPSLQKILAMRHCMNKVIRDYLDRDGFLELETPLLGRSTPEGARDYLVPSRVWPGAWFALPQSPQIYKQLLMVGGYDKYYQIAHCLRDEDLRADRQPEFTQLDLEMSFVKQDDVLEVIERLTVEVFAKCVGAKIARPFTRLTCAEAMARFGSDKPDLRFAMEIVDLTDLGLKTEFRVFKEAVEGGGKLRGICAKNAAGRFSNTDLKPGGKLSDFVIQCGGKGLAWLKVENGKITSTIEKFIPKEVQEEMRARLGAVDGDLILLVADKEEIASQALGSLRIHLARQLGLLDGLSGQYQICWVVDFPSFIFDAEEKRWVANHHPFTSPREEDLGKLESDPGSVMARAYDLVINGYECGGGSIRIHDPEVQARLFSVLGMTPEQARHRFGFLLDALKYGAPPHGGIALGLDRWAMILAGTANIRDVIAFPKNQKARDLMTGAPASVDARQLKELGL